MKKSLYNGQRGFTIIEVVLVLGIAGLIFLMVFIALPALQRTQRDSARRDDVLLLLRKVKDYQTNNRGALPNGVGSTIAYNATPADRTNWEGFYHDYLGDGFDDPNGTQYVLNVAACGASSSGSKCTNALTDTTVFPNDFKITIFKGATCSGSDAVATNNPRKIAVQYKLEGGGVICENT